MTDRIAEPARDPRPHATDPQAAPTPRAPDARDAEVPHGHAPEGFRSHGPQGTTHDPNSVTTGTEVEPDDAYPPKGEDGPVRRH